MDSTQPAAEAGAAPAPSEARTASPTPPATIVVPGAVAAFVGWMMVALVDAIMMAIHHGGTAPLTRVVQAYVYQTGNAVVAGLLSAIAIVAFGAVRGALIKPERRLANRLADVVGMLGAAIQISWVFLRHDFDSYAGRKGADSHISGSLVRIGCVAALACGLTLAYALARWLAVSWRRYVGVTLAVAIAVANYFYLGADYFNLHFAAAWVAALVFGVSVLGIRVPVRFRPLALALVTPLAVAGGSVLLIPPPPGVVSRMLSTSHDPFTPLLELRGYHGREGRAVVPAEQAEWFRPRNNAPWVASTNDDLEGADQAIVLMLTVDCFRGDKYADEHLANLFPELAGMKQEGVYFENTHSPGSQTIYTMTSWFTGKYFSEQVWKPKRKGELLSWPAEDPTLRFPNQMDESGVPSLYVMAGNWLGSTNGLVRGFSQVADLKAGSKYNDYARARNVADVVIDRLEHVDSGPLYVFAHFLDAHMPYKDIKLGAPPTTLYLRELTIVDGEIARIRARVRELGLENRTTIIFSADHGESLGDHGLRDHGVSVYEELIHVPLVIIGPKFPPRVVDTSVSTIDLGPTILDIYGLPTPGWMMGQSLLPVLEGGEFHFTRPIVAENRLRQMMLFPDGVKISRDLHFGDGDVFDLKRDPHELDNRIDDPTLDTRNRFALLRAFFEAHTNHTKGYSPPYRR